MFTTRRRAKRQVPGARREMQATCPQAMAYGSMAAANTMVEDLVLRGETGGGGTRPGSVEAYEGSTNRGDSSERRASFGGDMVSTWVNEVQGASRVGNAPLTNVAKTQTPTTSLVSRLVSATSSSVRARPPWFRSSPSRSPRSRWPSLPRSSDVPPSLLGRRDGGLERHRTMT